ncbi:dodecin [Phenylobacterium sp.]|uniref:dodecin n=1 Tax=Phenylobacterium sp. TaxID=1871053 RepID=UPI0008B5F85B|nr:dodecin [Phenylobacterium sp.]MBA4792809.1 dodecin domain-containing protein [Phenylobacterium sp.]MBC7168421.1 dodecin domain-containing protein [Phenylobacterium sp.]OHB33059.1 MAG: dodecin flavoprotein [Phenylobacterium sp. RIFCSPHIGHO2_01_FULL_70_10]
MSDHVYRVVEVVGSSETSIEDAVRNAVTEAGKSMRELRWFEVMETRGEIADGQVRHFQVHLKLGFTLEDSRG